jgi:hypothetical protein
MRKCGGWQEKRILAAIPIELELRPRIFNGAYYIQPKIVYQSLLLIGQSHRIFTLIFAPDLPYFPKLLLLASISLA